MSLRVLFLLLTLIQCSASADEDTFLISHASHPAAETYKRFMSKVYEDIGIKVQFIEMPVKRRLMVFNQGLVDADLGGRDRLTETYPNIRKVPVELTRATGYLVCPENVPCDLQVFADPSNQVFMDDADRKVFLDNFDFEIKAKVSLLEDDNGVIDMFDAGRIDYMITSTVANAPDFKINRKHNRYKTLEVSIFHYVHERHYALIPQLTQSIERNLEQLRTQNATEAEH